MNMKENAAHVLDLFEAEQQSVLALDPRERGMQHHYSQTMSTCHELRQFIAKLSDTRANTPDSAAQGAMDRNQLVDEALAKIATLGTIGAMKWLGAQYSNSSKPTDATAQPITDERAAFENAIAICDDYYDKQLPMMKAGNQSEDYLSGYNNACGDLGHVFRALKSAPAAITGKDAK